MKVLIAFPFSIFPVKSGGGLRGFNLLVELARHHDVQAIVVDDSDGLLESVTEALGTRPQSLRITQAAMHVGARRVWKKVMDWLTTMWLSRSLTAKSNSVTLAITRVLAHLSELQQQDVVILSTQELAICGTYIGRAVPAAVRVVDLHNLDHLLGQQAIRNRQPSIGACRRLRELERVESNLFSYADGVFACSEADLGMALKINSGKLAFGAVVPNGVSCDRISFDCEPSKPGSEHVLFCGSLSYGPNVDGLEWFHAAVWPLIRHRLPQARLMVVGRGFDPSRLRSLLVDDSVDLIGEVDDLQPYYMKAGVSVCPVRMGSGTRLKILEAMAYGNPVVSTSIGCEGLSVVDGEDLLIRNSAGEFAKAVVDLISKPADFERIRSEARRRVERLYEWRLIGVELARTLSVWCETKRRLR